MSNRDFFLGGWLGSVFGMTLLVGINTIDPSDPTEAQVGYNYQQLKEMKAECEKDLPRSTECSIVVYYQPAAELEKTE
jgi:hypothetical protein